LQFLNAHRLFTGFQPRVDQYLIDHVFQMGRLFGDNLKNLLVFGFDLAIEPICHALNVADDDS
jgi:hypothetical protein